MWGRAIPRITRSIWSYDYGIGITTLFGSFFTSLVVAFYSLSSFNPVCIHEETPLQQPPCLLSSPVSYISSMSLGFWSGKKSFGLAKREKGGHWVGVFFLFPFLFL